MFASTSTASSIRQLYRSTLQHSVMFSSRDPSLPGMPLNDVADLSQGGDRDRGRSRSRASTVRPESIDRQSSRPPSEPRGRLGARTSSYRQKGPPISMYNHPSRYTARPDDSRGRTPSTHDLPPAPSSRAPSRDTRERRSRSGDDDGHRNHGRHSRASSTVRKPPSAPSEYVSQASKASSQGPPRDHRDRSPGEYSRMQDGSSGRGKRRELVVSGAMGGSTEKQAKSRHEKSERTSRAPKASSKSSSKLPSVEKTKTRGFIYNEDNKESTFISTETMKLQGTPEQLGAILGYGSEKSSKRHRKLHHRSAQIDLRSGQHDQPPSEPETVLPVGRDIISRSVQRDRSVHDGEGTRTHYHGHDAATGFDRKSGHERAESTYTSETASNRERYPDTFYLGAQRIEPWPKHRAPRTEKESDQWFDTAYLQK